MQVNYYKRLEADYLEKLEVWWLKANGWLQPGIGYHTISWCRNNVDVLNIGLRVIITPDNRFIELLYRLIGPNGKKKQIDTQVMLLSTKCNYGGMRYWFECPSCYKRIGILYNRSGHFACRHCQHLTYVSKNVSGIEKTTGRIVSDKEIESFRLKVKRKIYNGKITKNYVKYVKKLMKQKYVMKVLLGSDGLSAKTLSNTN